MLGLGICQFSLGSLWSLLRRGGDHRGARRAPASYDLAE
jgi:hypothetical protein